MKYTSLRVKISAQIKNKNEKELSRMPFKENELYVTIKVSKGGICEFSYGTERVATNLLKTFRAKPGRWVGAKIGLFCTRTNVTNDAGFADVDWIRFNK